MMATSRLVAVLVGNALLRIAGSAGGLLVGFYLASLTAQGRPVEAGLVGALGVAISVAEFGGSIPLGTLVDRYSARTLLVVSALLGAGATQLFGMTGVIAIFFVSRVLEGLSSAAATPALLVHLGVVTQENRDYRNRVMSFFEVSLLAGLALGGVVGGVLWDEVGSVAFSLLAVVYLGVAGLFWWGAAGAMNPVDVSEYTVSPIEHIRNAFANPTLRRLAPAWVVVNAVVGLWLTHIGFQMARPAVTGQWLVGRFTATQVGAISLGYAVVFALGIVVWGFVMWRFTRLQVMRWAVAGMFVVNFCFYLLNGSTGWEEWQRIVVLVVYALAVMVQAGFTPAALAFLADSADEEAGRGTVMGIYSLLLGLGNALGAGLGGVLASYWYLNGLVVGTVFLGVIGWGVLSLIDEPRGVVAGN